MQSRSVQKSQGEMNMASYQAKRAALARERFKIYWARVGILGLVYTAKRPVELYDVAQYNETLIIHSIIRCIEWEINDKE